VTDLYRHVLIVLLLLFSRCAVFAVGLFCDGDYTVGIWGFGFFFGKLCICVFLRRSRGWVLGNGDGTMGNERLFLFGFLLAESVWALGLK